MWASGKIAVAGAAIGFDSRCSIQLSTPLTVVTDTWTKIPFDQPLYDNDSEFDIVTNHRFVAKVEGVYHTAASIALLCDGVSTILECTIYKNGNAIKGNKSTVQADGYVRCHVCGDIPLAVDDYIEVWGWHNRGIDKDVKDLDIHTYFDISRFV